MKRLALCMAIFLLLIARDCRAAELQAFFGVGGMILPRGGPLNSAIAGKIQFLPTQILQPWLELGYFGYFSQSPASTSGLTLHGGGMLGFDWLRLSGGLGLTRLAVTNRDSGLSAAEWDVSTSLSAAVLALKRDDWQLWTELKLENIQFAGLTAAYAGFVLSL